MIDGLEVKLGDATLIAPPLNLAAVRRLLPKVKQMVDATSPLEAVDMAVDVLHASLVRNHPEVTREQIEEGLGFREALALSTAVLESSGFVSGNAMAATPPSPSTGIDSTAS